MSHQLQAFKTIYDLLQEDGESLRKRSKQRRSEVSRARDLVADIYLRLGPEVFFLCIIALPVSTLAKLKPRLFLRKLEDWWKETHHPQGLKLAAIGLCRDNSISNIITSYRKRQYPELSILLDQRQPESLLIESPEILYSHELEQHERDNSVAPNRETVNIVLERETQNEQEINRSKRKRSVSQADQDKEGPGSPEI